VNQDANISLRLGGYEQGQAIEDAVDSVILLESGFRDGKVPFQSKSSLGGERTGGGWTCRGKLGGSVDARGSCNYQLGKNRGRFMGLLVQEGGEDVLSVGGGGGVVVWEGVGGKRRDWGRGRERVA